MAYRHTEHAAHALDNSVLDKALAFEPPGKRECHVDGIDSQVEH